MKKIKDIFQSARPAFSGSQKSSPLVEWFRVWIDDATISLQVNPPNRESWEAQIRWERVIRVCFNAGDLYNPDEIYIFTDERPESYVIPTEASGGHDLWNEIVRRKLFDAEVAIEAMAAINKLFCCPPIE